MAWSVGRIATFFAAGVLVVACVPIWGDADAVPSGSFAADCKLACDTMAACATRLKSARLLSSQNCQVFCLANVDRVDGKPHAPLHREFAWAIYAYYVRKEAQTCDAFEHNRFGMPATTVESWIHSHGAELQPCIEHTTSICKATQEQAETTCVYEQGIFDGVGGLAECVTSDKTCEAAAECRRDRAREAGWVEEDKPWWGVPP